MLETLSRGFRNAKARLTGVTELTPDNIEDALRDVRMSLLEADVEFKVIKTFLDRVKEKAIGETVKLRAKAGDRALSATPEQHFIQICQDELIELMGPVDTDLDWAKKGPTGIMMVGLQGSGKTTTVGKLAQLAARRGQQAAAGRGRHLPSRRRRAAQGARRAARHAGLHHRGRRRRRRSARRRYAARVRDNCDVVLFDTAGRLAIDEALMAELDDDQERDAAGRTSSSSSTR